MNQSTHRLPLLGRLYLWATHRLYNELAWAYDLAAWIVSAGRWDRWRRLALDFIGHGPVLEIGFGTGELLMAMAARNVPAVGIDLSPAMHRVTAAKLRQRGISVPCVRGPVQQLPFADGSFERVVSTFPAEFIGHPASLQEIYRVLRRPDPRTGRGGGRLIVVGTVVLVRCPLAERLGRLLFAGSPDRFLARFLQRAEEAGFAVTIVDRYDPPAQLPVIIAERTT